jgi:hypothetical protein
MLRTREGVVERVVLTRWKYAARLPDIRAFSDSAVIVFGRLRQGYGAQGRSRSTACARNLRVA